MEPLFLAVICACNAGLIREALHEVYIPRIQRGDAFFTANVLGARGPLLSVLVHFFEDGQWGSPAETAIEGQSLTRQDRLYILLQAALYLTSTRGYSAPEARICYEQAESLSHSLNRPLLLHSALMGQWLYSLWAGKLTATMQIAKRVHSFANIQNDPALMTGAYRALAVTLYFLGDFESTRTYALRGVQTWRSWGAQSAVEEVTASAVPCLGYQALSAWQLGEIASCHAAIGEAISLARELHNMHGLAVALTWAAILGYCERNLAEVERCSSDAIELSTRHHFAFYLAAGFILRGWTRGASDDTAEGISWIENGIRDYRATGAVLRVPFFLGLKAEALYLADRTSEALEAINEAEALVERFEDRHWCAELHRLRGVFLAATGADETPIEASFCAAINTAKEQKSVSLEKRAEATYTEYRRQKASASGARGFRLPLC